MLSSAPTLPLTCCILSTFLSLQSYSSTKIHSDSGSKPPAWPPRHLVHPRDVHPCSVSDPNAGVLLQSPMTCAMVMVGFRTLF